MNHKDHKTKTGINIDNKQHLQMTNCKKEITFHYDFNSNNKIQASESVMLNGAEKLVFRANSNNEPTFIKIGQEETDALNKTLRMNFDSILLDTCHQVIAQDKKELFNLITVK